MLPVTARESGMAQEGPVDNKSEDLWTPCPVALPVFTIKQPVLLASVWISAKDKPAEIQQTARFSGPR